MRIAFIGSAGIPNRYGGFESFLENCGPRFAAATTSTVVTCDASLYPGDISLEFQGVRRIFLNTSANGASSVLHDLIAFLRVFRGSTHIIILGVSGGPWFPLFLLMCRLGGKRLGVNIDGVEWRRSKYSPFKKIILRLFDNLAQIFSDLVIYDNAGLVDYILPVARKRAVEIAYSGDHVRRLPGVRKEVSTALTVCRIEPENNLPLLIEGALQSGLRCYTIVGNWNNSQYGKALRARYSGESRLQLMDPIYDPDRLAELREGCAIYLHGHSVGGTNPSLVEMLYYDCAVLCFDVKYNRATAGLGASYFKDVDCLVVEINSAIDGHAGGDVAERSRLRKKYTSSEIVNAYLSALMRCNPNG
jgi:glycosyltransferase involved in cell wall biosynthesis